MTQISPVTNFQRGPMGDADALDMLHYLG